MIYLDHAATTPLAPEAREAMLPFLGEQFGNPSSIHAAGRQVRAALDVARDAIAQALNVEFAEITFTSGGTEAANLAILGIMLAASPERYELIVSSIEHPCVLKAAEFVRRLGKQVTILPVDGEGFVHPDALRESISERTALVSVMHANNEIGTIQDIPKLATIAHEAGALFHADAVQTFGALPVLPRAMGVDLVSISAHKIYGPKGVGALYARAGLTLSPVLHGGSQERERRGGTENVPGIIGFGRAVELSMQHRETRVAHDRELRDHFIRGVLAAIPSATMNGPQINNQSSRPNQSACRRLPNNANFSFPGQDGASLLMMLDRAGICASSGSACSSGSIEPSPVLTAIGLTSDLANSAVRFTVGEQNTEAEINEVVRVLAKIVQP
jgi:cysteine desulfurase